MDENPYEAPRAEAGDRRPVRVRIGWLQIVLLIMIVFFLVALLLPATQPGKSSNEQKFNEWKRQREAEQSASEEVVE
jgi:hypothetical protein